MFTMLNLVIQQNGYVFAMEELVKALIDIVDTLGYLGVFFALLIESTFIPIPGELSMIPAGILVGQGKMDYWTVLFMSTAGVIAGSLINYWIGYHFGRRLLVKYGKYFFMKHGSLEKIEHFYKEHGPISTFTGRLIPGVRHYIAFPAGLANMNLKKFILYTSLGGLIWMWVLLHIGFYVGENSSDVVAIVAKLKIALIIIVAILIAGYIYKRRYLK